MKIALVSHFFPPEPCAAATRVSSLVAALEQHGHDVTVVTNFPSFPAGRYAAGERNALCRVERTGACAVVRLRGLLLARVPGARLVHWASAAVAASVYLLASRKRFDVVIASMPPITLALPALAGAARHRARLVVDVRDVFPDIAVAMGAWRAGGVLARSAEWIVRRLYARADLIVAVTPTALAQIASRGIEPERLMLARNAAEIAAVSVVSTGHREGFRAVYAGNLGLATDVDIMLEAAELLVDDGIHVEIVGGGAQRARVLERVRERSLANVTLRESVPRDEAMRILADGDVALVPLRKGIKESVPTKLYDALSVGTPAIVCAEGEAADEAANLGARCVAAGDAAALAAELCRMQRLDRAQVRALGERARQRLAARTDRAGIMDALALRISALA